MISTPSAVSDYLKLAMVAVVLAVVVLSGRAVWKHLSTGKLNVNSYQRCVETGGKVEHGIPPVCTAKGGRQFIGSPENMYQVTPQR